MYGGTKHIVVVIFNIDLLASGTRFQVNGTSKACIIPIGLVLKWF